MWSELFGTITTENYNYLSGLAGLVCGFTVHLFWSRGL